MGSDTLRRGSCSLAGRSFSSNKTPPLPLRDWAVKEQPTRRDSSVLTDVAFRCHPERARRRGTSLPPSPYLSSRSHREENGGPAAPLFPCLSAFRHLSSLDTAQRLKPQVAHCKQSIDTTPTRRSNEPLAKPFFSAKPTMASPFRGCATQRSSAINWFSRNALNPTSAPWGRS
jgi:hypothetical protein